MITKSGNQSDNNIFLIAQNIRSLYNVGALFRCSDVFNVSKIYICGITGYPPRKEISKTALGAQEWVSWQNHRQAHALIKRLKRDGVHIVALETSETAILLPNFKPKFPLALVVGSEINGISKAVLKLADEVIKIPMLGKKESLNVAVAAAIALYDIRTKTLF